MPVSASAGTTDDSQTRSVSQAPVGVTPVQTASLSFSVRNWPTRSRCGMAASTGSVSPELNSST